MGSLERRLEALERETDPAELIASSKDWPLDEQLASVADMLDFYIHFHSRDTVRYSATDRELHLLGLLCAIWELGPDGGLFTFPSGLTVRLLREGDSFLIDAPRKIRAEDLPEWTREHFERMDAKKHQAERDRWLYEHRHLFEPWREQVRRVEEEQQRGPQRAARRRRRGQRPRIGATPPEPQRASERPWWRRVFGG